MSPALLPAQPNPVPRLLSAAGLQRRISLRQGSPFSFGWLAYSSLFLASFASPDTLSLLYFMRCQSRTHQVESTPLLGRLHAANWNSRREFQAGVGLAGFHPN